MTEKRKLSTVLFADIVGYTSLMQSDEQQALLFLNHFKKLIEKIIPEHEGEIIQYYGDAVLLTFDSAKDGVDCSLALQRAFKEKEIPIRIGMHLGDVVFKNENVFGDGVNIASRIESIGVSGSILVSKAIRDQISNKSAFSLASLGAFDFKNVKESITVFALANEGLVVPTTAELKGKGKQVAQKQSNWPSLAATVLLIVGVLFAGFYFFSGNSASQLSDDESNITSTIAVFPFDVKGSPDITYLGEGIVDLISTQLDEIPQLNSVDPNRIFSQLENKTTISRNPEKAAKLSQAYGANKFILGSLVQVGDDLQISATKYNAQGNEITRQSVKANAEENTATTINNLIKILVADELAEADFELGSLGAVTSDNLESLKLYLRGEKAYRDLEYLEARELFTQATELDSTFALAWMRLFEAEGWIGWNSNAASLNKWSQYKHTMPKKWQLFHEASVLHYLPDRKAIAAYKKLIQLYPGTAVFHYGLAEFYFHLNAHYGRSPLAAKPHLLKTLEMDPGNQEALFHIGQIAAMEDDQQGMDLALSLRGENPAGTLKMLELIVMDTVTNADIDHALSETSGTVFLTSLYFVNQEKPFNNELVSRVIQKRPSENGIRLANSVKHNTSGREKEGFEAWKEIAKLGFSFGTFTTDQLYRCIPAVLMYPHEYLPFQEHFDLLYADTKDRDSAFETYAAIKYALALNKTQEVTLLKEKLQNLANTPHEARLVKHFYYSIKAFEAKLAGEDDLALAYIDSCYQTPIGFWESQTFYFDKTILAANIYAGRGEYDKAIDYFNHSYFITLGGDLAYGYSTYKLSQWYEAIGDYNNALTKCNILLKSYKDCDEKYKPWVEEVRERKERMIGRVS